MITPLMHILSCLDEKYQVGPPVDILYLGKTDRELIIHEARRLGVILNDADKIMCSVSDTGLEMVAPQQEIAGSLKSINPYTGLLLTRVRSCLATYNRELDTVAPDVAEDDLSTDAVVLRLEGNARYAFVYVYKIMETPALSYDAKIAKLRELLLTIKSHSVVENNELKDGNLKRRLELHSMFNYWKGMLMSDYIRYYGVEAPTFDETTLKVMKSELNDLGFYGFVNPLAMYQEFNNSRVARKVEVNIDDSVVEYLSKIVLSGGGTVE